MADKKNKKQSPKSTVKRVTAAKKPAKQAKAKTNPAAKSAAKKLTAKAAPKRTIKAVKAVQTNATAKNSKAAKLKIKPLKPDMNFENSTGEDNKIIVLKGQKQQKRAKSEKKLKRVASLGGYTAWDGRTGKTFATKKEALDFAIDVLKRTGEIIPVTKTQRQVSHTFKAENKTEN